MTRKARNTMMLPTVLDALAVVCGILVFCTGTFVGFFAVVFSKGGAVGFIFGVGSGSGIG